MDVSDIIALARTLTHTDTDQVSPTDGLTYANIVYKKIASEITQRIDEDYFWDLFTTDTVLNQSEYVLPIADATTIGLRKITRCEIKWDSDDTYRKLVPADTLASYPLATDELEAQASKEKGFFDIKDGSLFIYPSPEEAITDGLQIGVITTLADLTASTLSANVFPNNSELRDYHDVISIGMKQYIYAQQGQINEKNDAINEFRVKLDELIDILRDRWMNPVETQLPSGTSLKY